MTKRRTATTAASSPTTDPDLARMFAEIDGYFSTFAIIADREEELGHTDRARAWRLLAKSRLFPLWRQGKYRWLASRVTQAPHKIPTCLCEVVPASSALNQKTRSQAYVALVDAICLWVRSGPFIAGRSLIAGPEAAWKELERELAQGKAAG